MADRTVSVKLVLDAAGYKRSAEEAAVATDRLDNKVQTTDRDLKKLPRDGAEAAAAMKLLGVEAGKTKVALDDGLGKGSTSLGVLDQKLVEARTEVRKLADEFNRTGDAGTLDKLFKADKAIKDLEKLRKVLSDTLKGAIDDAGSDDKTRSGFWSKLFSWTGVSGLIQNFQGLGLQAGDAFGKGFKGFLDAMPAELKVVLIGIIAGVIAASLSAIGAALNGLLLSTVGLGGIGLIVAGQFQSPIVRSAVSQLGHDLMNALGSATSGLAGRLGFGAGVLDTGLVKLVAALQPALDKLSGAIGPLAQGLSKMLLAMGPGLSKALDAAMPMLLLFAKLLPGIGRAFSGMFSDLASSSRGGAEGLQYFVLGLEVLIRAVGIAIKTLSGLFQFFVAFADVASGVLSKVAGWIPVLGDWINKNHDMFHNMRGGLDEAGLATDNLGSSFTGLGQDIQSTTTLVQQAAAQFQNLSKGIDAAFGRVMGIDQATLQWNQSLLALSDSVQKNGTDLRVTTKEGEANLGVVQQSISSINSLRDANIANGMSIGQANGIYQQQLNQLQNTLVQLGFNKDAVKAMIDQYRAIPSQVSTVVNVLGLDAATTKLVSVKQKLDDLNGKITTTYVVVDTQTGQTSTHTRSQGYNRWGGIYEHAETGLLNAGVYSSMSPARYAFAEPATGGEAFVPRRGDYGRSTAILDRAARWYGGRFAPMGGGGSGGTLRVELAFTGGNDALSSLLAKMERTGDLHLTATRV